MVQNAEEQRIESSSISVSAKQGVMHIASVSEDCECKLLQYDRSYLRSMTFQLNLLDAFKYVYINSKLTFKLPQNDFNDLWLLTSYIERQLVNTQNIEIEKHILRHLNYSFLYSTIEKMDRTNQFEANPTNQKEKLVLQFFHNLQKKGNFKLKVRDYAEMQKVTTRHLSASIKQLTGMTAQEIIHRLLLSKAKKELSATLKPVSEIALDLGYTDPYTFSHFFKRNTGMSPSDFRKNYQD